MNRLDFFQRKPEITQSFDHLFGLTPGGKLRLLQ